MLDAQYMGNLSVDTFIVVNYFEPAECAWKAAIMLGSHRGLVFLLRYLDA